MREGPRHSVTSHFPSKESLRLDCMSIEHFHFHYQYHVVMADTFMRQPPMESLECGNDHHKRDRLRSAKSAYKTGIFLPAIQQPPSAHAHASHTTAQSSCASFRTISRGEIGVQCHSVGHQTPPPQEAA